MVHVAPGARGSRRNWGVGKVMLGDVLSLPWVAPGGFHRACALCC